MHAAETANAEAEDALQAAAEQSLKEAEEVKNEADIKKFQAGSDR